MMSGERNLQILLSSAAPQHNPGRFVFCTVADVHPTLWQQAVATIREQEGVTLVLAQDVAEAHGLKYEYIAGWITLKVHSSLAAVGLTAAFSQALASQQISCNVVAGYYHDHIFVAEDDVTQAMEILQSLGNK
ncbi:ACT domain-containing protein [Snodgrassella sp. B3882]|nr:ACT domain-containing protein [Snodgrassella sp. B3882]